MSSINSKYCLKLGHMLQKSKYNNRKFSFWFLVEVKSKKITLLILKVISTYDRKQ